MNPYPIQQNPSNGWQIAGQAASQLGSQVSDFGDKQIRLKQLFQEMQDKQAAKIRADWEFQKKVEDDAKKTEFENAAKTNFAISPILANNQDLAQPTAPPAIPAAAQADVADLENVTNADGTTLASQAVKATPTADSLMNDAVNRTPSTASEGLPRSRAEIAALGLSLGQGDVNTYLNATDPMKTVEGAQAIAWGKGFGSAAGKLVGGAIPNEAESMGKLHDQLAHLAEQGLHPTKDRVISMAQDIDPNFTKSQSFKTTIAGYSPYNPMTSVRAGMLDLMNRRFNENAHNDEGLKLSPPTPQQTGRVVALTKSAHELMLLNNLIASIPEDQRGLLIGQITARNPYSGTVAQIKNLLTSLAGKMPQALEGINVGGSEKLTEEHQNMIPKINESVASAQAKADLLANELPSAWQNFIGGMKDAQRNTAPYESIQDLEGMANYHLSHNNQVAPNPGSYRAPGKDLLGPGAGEAPPSTPPRGKLKSIDAATAAQYLKDAGGDRKKAKADLARAGYNVNG